MAVKGTGRHCFQGTRRPDSSIPHIILHGRAGERIAKRDILRGDFGAPLQAKTIVLWPRGFCYFSRNSWAGAIRDSQGRAVYDSPVNNATAHFLHNMLYLTGPALDRSFIPDSIEFEVYKINAIENYDTAFIRCCSEPGPKILFYTSQASGKWRQPLFELKFEKGSVRYDDTIGTIEAYLTDGTCRNYGNPFENPYYKRYHTLDAIRSGSFAAVCGIEAAAAQTVCSNAIQDNLPPERGFIGAKCSTIDTTEQGEVLSVEGLYTTALACYQEEVLPSERNTTWSHPAVKVDAAPYRTRIGL